MASEHKMRKLFLAIIVFVLILFLNGCSNARSQTVAHAPIQPVQVKACEVAANWYTLPCTFDAPVTAGDLIVVVAGMGCFNYNCNSVSDSQGNVWKVAVVVPYWNGEPLWYALNAKGGTDTISFAPGTGQIAIVAEYPPAIALENANQGTYAFQYINGARSFSDGTSDIGYTLPVETSESCELLIAWGSSGSGQPGTIHGTHVPSAGPGFTVRESSYGAMGLEDMTTSAPGLYMGTMGWNTYGHWLMGVAAFKMGGCK
jgi:hypothetical protein